MIANFIRFTSIPCSRKVGDFSQARHTVIGRQNIANMDTPGYKVHDLSVEDFNPDQQAITERRQPSSASEGFSPAKSD